MTDGEKKALVALADRFERRSRTQRMHKTGWRQASQQLYAVLAGLDICATCGAISIFGEPHEAGCPNHPGPAGGESEK